MRLNWLLFFVQNLVPHIYDKVNDGQEENGQANMLAMTLIVIDFRLATKDLRKHPIQAQTEAPRLNFI